MRVPPREELESYPVFRGHEVHISDSSQKVKAYYLITTVPPGVRRQRRLDLCQRFFTGKYGEINEVLERDLLRYTVDEREMFLLASAPWALESVPK